MLGDVVKSHEELDDFPDYTLSIDGDVLRMTPKRDFLMQMMPEIARSIYLKGYAHEDARSVLRGWCPQAAEDAWRAWIAKEKIKVRKPEEHFLNFCKTYAEKRGSAPGHFESGMLL
ncbi:MAG: hypothetical protein AAFV38_12540 [Pseudomonadota bacterium]